MKQLIYLGLSISSLLMVNTVAAELARAPAVLTPSPVTIEWNNNHPQQRQALDHFYQSLQSDVNAQAQAQAPYTIQRQQHIEHIRATRSPSMAAPVPIFQPHSDASRLLQ